MSSSSSSPSSSSCTKIKTTITTTTTTNNNSHSRHDDTSFSLLVDSPSSSSLTMMMKDDIVATTMSSHTSSSTSTPTSTVQQHRYLRRQQQQRQRLVGVIVILVILMMMVCTGRLLLIPSSSSSSSSSLNNHKNHDVTDDEDRSSSSSSSFLMSSIVSFVSSSLMDGRFYQWSSSLSTLSLLWQQIVVEPFHSSYHNHDEDEEDDDDQHRRRLVEVAATTTTMTTNSDCIIENDNFLLFQPPSLSSLSSMIEMVPKYTSISSSSSSMRNRNNNKENENENNDNFCHLYLPKHISSTVLWNEYLESWIIPSTTSALTTSTSTTTPTTTTTSTTTSSSNSLLFDPTIIYELGIDWMTSKELKHGIHSLIPKQQWKSILHRIQTRILYLKEMNTNQKQNENEEETTTTTTGVSPIPRPPPPLVIVVVGAQFQDQLNSPCHVPNEFLVSTNKNNNKNGDSSNNNNRNDWNCTWPVMVQSMLNQILLLPTTMTEASSQQQSQSQQEKKIIEIIPVLLDDSNTDFAILLAKYDLWPPRVVGTTTTSNIPQQQQLPQPPDIIIHTYSSHDMANLNRSDVQHISDTVDFEVELRRKYQTFFRTVAQSQPCTTSSSNPTTNTVGVGQPPIVFFFDDYLGGQGHDSLFDETIHTRVQSRLADWYPTMGLISYASIVRSLVYANTELQLFWNGGGNGGGGTSNNKSSISIYHGQIAHLIMTWTIVFALLEITVDHCSQQELEYEAMMADAADATTADSGSGSGGLLQQPLPFLQPGVQELVEDYTILPPELTLSLELSKISSTWKQEQEQQKKRRKELCPTITTATTTTTTTDSSGGVVDKEEVENDPVDVDPKISSSSSSSTSSPTSRFLLPSHQVCPLHFWKGHNQIIPLHPKDKDRYYKISSTTTTTTTDNQVKEYTKWLHPMIQSKDDGWHMLLGPSTSSFSWRNDQDQSSTTMISRDMIWTSETVGSQWVLQIPLESSSTSSGTIHIFVQTYNDQIMTTPSELKVDVSSSPSSSPSSSLVILNTHPSDVTLAKPYHISLNQETTDEEDILENNDTLSSTTPTTVTLTLTVQTQGTVPIEIVALMVCNDKDDMLRRRRHDRSQ